MNRRTWRYSATAALVVVACGAVAGGLLASQSAHSHPPSHAARADDPLIAAAGDIACAEAEAARVTLKQEVHRCSEGLTADVMSRFRLTAVLPLGDLQYQCGKSADFASSYGQTWGRFKDISHPVVGNHEYGRICGRDDASAYFDYFGAAAGTADKGWYSYDLGSWHFIALNSECSYGSGKEKVGGCNIGSEQEQWLRSDLADHKNFCTLAYWHEPRFSSGEHGNAQQMADIWNELVAAHVDIVLSGHNHDYERFDPLGTAAADAAQPTPDRNGIREFVVGTGGKNHYGFPEPMMRGEVVRNGDAFGVLLLTLHDRSYDWRFVPVQGATFTDSGSGACH
jgi:hypothetical protein